MGWCGSAPSPHPVNQTVYVTAFIATGLHKVRIGAVAVGCVEWCETHQLVGGLKNFDTRNLQSTRTCAARQCTARRGVTSWYRQSGGGVMEASGRTLTG